MVDQDADGLINEDDISKMLQQLGALCLVHSALQPDQYRTYGALLLLIYAVSFAMQGRMFHPLSCRATS